MTHEQNLGTQGEDFALKAFLTSADPVEIDPLRLARLEAQLMQRLPQRPQQRVFWPLGPQARRAPRAMRLMTSATSRLTASALFCLMLGVWVGTGTSQTTATPSASSVQVSSTTADTGVSANLPLLAMASPWQEWVSWGEER